MNSKIKKLLAFVVCLSLALMMSVSCFAAEGDSFTMTDFQPLISGLTSHITVTSMLAVLSGGVAAGAVFWAMWWGSRKLIKIVMAAIARGKLSV